MSHLMITHVTWTGSTNDCTAWDNSLMKKRIEESCLPPQYYFIGDDGFTCSNEFLTPWSGTGIGVDKDSFNYHLSVRRQVIERAFGILVRRWGILWRPLDVGLTKWSLIATVCAKLHNICVDMNDIKVQNRLQKDILDGDTDDVIFNVVHNEDDNRPQIAHGRTLGNRRLNVTHEIHRIGIRRSEYAGRNSRA
jgi:hypothetical protein